MSKRPSDAAEPAGKRAPATRASTLVHGDIFDEWARLPGAVLAHQCNCVTRRAAGLAAAVFARAPDANDYARPDARRTPGTAAVHGGRVANLYAQRGPGRPAAGDSADQRLRWFETALDDLVSKLPTDDKTAVLFPYGIGCGLARGRWADYEAAIERWACRHRGRVDVFICKQGSDTT